MTYVKTYLSTLKTHVVNLKRDAKFLSRDLLRLEVRGKLGSKTLYYYYDYELAAVKLSVRYNPQCCSLPNQRLLLVYMYLLEGLLLH